MDQNTRYLIERSEIRSIRTAIVRLPHSVKHNRTHNKVLSIDHSIAEHLFADYERETGSKKSTKYHYENSAPL